MKKEHFPTLIAAKVPAELAAEIRRAARADDRPVSAFLRRFLAAAFPPSGSRATKETCASENEP